MQIGALEFKPYIYNTNSVSAGSLDRVSGISDDVLSAQTDYSDLVADDISENILRKGETSNYADVLQMQFQMSRLNASRLIKPVEEMEEMFRLVDRPQTEPVQAEHTLYKRQKAAAVYGIDMYA